MTKYTIPELRDRKWAHNAVDIRKRPYGGWPVDYGVAVVFWPSWNSYAAPSCILSWTIGLDGVE